MTSKPISIFRTKEDILKAQSQGNIKIDNTVLTNREFNDAEFNELLGFKVVEGSDFKVIEVKKIKDDPRMFMELAFGKRE